MARAQRGRETDGRPCYEHDNDSDQYPASPSAAVLVVVVHKYIRLRLFPVQLHLRSGRLKCSDQDRGALETEKVYYYPRFLCRARRFSRGFGQLSDRRVTG